MTFTLGTLFLALTMGVFINSCKNDPAKEKVVSFEKSVPEIISRHSFSFLSPAANQTFTIGDQINVSLKSDTSQIDSIKVMLQGYYATVNPGKELNFTVPSIGLHPGSARLNLTIFITGGKFQDVSLPLRFLSDVKPDEYTYRIIKEYPHNRKYYTQGFEYYNEHFYEGTGQYNESTIRKVVYNTGEVIKSRSLESDIFGEGITILNGRLFQVTYRNKVGFVYDSETFELLRKIYFQNQEGWGLTNNGSEIIMSDGTNKIYFMDPEYFSVLRKIEVFDNIQEIDSLNELEFMDNLIYANRYQTDQIVMIDPQNGKVVGKVNMKGLLKQSDKQPSTDVLNGIAWDSEKKRLFVTGKYWPKVFHVELIKRP